MVPLKTQSSLDDNIVDSIFYMIPEIFTHHSIYLDFLDNVWKNWNSKASTVGNIILTIVSNNLRTRERTLLLHPWIMLLNWFLRYLRHFKFLLFMLSFQNI